MTSSRPKMPTPARWFVRASLLYLLLGTLLGGALLLEKALGVTSPLWRLLGVHGEWLLMGWLLQLALGVAAWILPRPRPEVTRSPGLWASFALLNGGLLLRTVGAALGVGPGPLAALATGLQAAAVVTFAVAAWQRLGYRPR